jgi:hypothetical protein
VYILGSLLAWAARPRERAYVALLALYGLVTLALLGLAEGNLGNLLRHRMMLVPTFLVLGGAGLHWAWVHRRGLRIARPVAAPTREDAFARPGTVSNRTA